MNTFAIALVVASSFFHAGWNLLARFQRAEHTFLLRMQWLAATTALPAAAVAMLAGSGLPGKVWLCMLGTGVAFGFYILSLARAYGSGEFTVVYPITRGFPIILVGLGDVARGRLPTGWGWLGMALVVVACSLVPLHSLRRVSLRHYLNRNMLWIILTAFCVVAYTLIDKIAAESVRRGPGSAMIYNFGIFAVGVLVLSANLKIFGRPAEDAKTVGWWRPALAGLLTVTSYFLVLWAYQLTERAGYILAFRQVSIIIGVVVALGWLKERGTVHRLIASGLMIAGLILIATLG